jgi:hypothetical protein
MENVHTTPEHHALVSGLEFSLANRAHLCHGHSVKSDRLPPARRYVVRQPGVERR